MADCYDALTSDRPYGKGLPKQQTLSMLREKAGIQFDPDVIEVFTKMMDEDWKPAMMPVGAAGD